MCIGTYTVRARGHTVQSLYVVHLYVCIPVPDNNLEHNSSAVIII